MRDEHYFLAIRFCNIFTKISFCEFKSYEERYSIKIFLRHLDFPTSWKICRHKIAEVVNTHQDESLVKIKLCLEYCKYLLNFNFITVDQREIERNHKEFLLVIRKCLRLMKKLYSLNVKKYIPELKKIILRSFTFYEKELPLK